MKEIMVINNVMPRPEEYRDHALKQNFRTYTFSQDEVFHGIALAGHYMSLPTWISERFPSLMPKVSFFRKSPLGQPEPTFIHSDDGMGDWTGILYLNEHPTVGDGTKFWKHKETGAILAKTSETDQFQNDFSSLDKWEEWRHVSASFNRLLLFPAPYFHSRAIFENYGADTDARLIQVVFGTGAMA